MLPKHGHFDLPEMEASEAPINLVGYATHRSYALHAMDLNAMGADEVA